MINCGNILNIDELEKVIQKRYCKDKFNVIFNGQYKEKCCIITIENRLPIQFYAETWENLHYQIRKYFD